MDILKDIKFINYKETKYKELFESVNEVAQDFIDFLNLLEEDHGILVFYSSADDNDIINALKVEPETVRNMVLQYYDFIEYDGFYMSIYPN